MVRFLWLHLAAKLIPQRLATPLLLVGPQLAQWGLEVSYEEKEPQWLVDRRGCELALGTSLIVQEPKAQGSA